MVDQVFHLKGSPKDALHNGGGGGELPKGVMVEVEIIRQGFAHYGALCLPALLTMTP
jgi:hypothetical protein